MRKIVLILAAGLLIGWTWPSWLKIPAPKKPEKKVKIVCQDCGKTGKVKESDDKTKKCWRCKPKKIKDK